MSALQWIEKPELDRPVLVAAFAGWNDAGEAATAAVQYMSGIWRGREFAAIDPEDFFDFTASRPHITLEDGITRRIDWPTNSFEAASVPGRGRDLVLLDGVEPQLKWKTFCAAVVEAAQALDVSRVVTLGGLLADVPHTRPAPVTGTTSSATLIDTAGLELSRYEGPTGITGVMHDAFAQAGIESASFWAAVPHYVGQTTSPKATLALLQRTAAFLDVPIELTELEIASTEYERQVTEVIEDDEDMIGYVEQLEEGHDEIASSDPSLVAEAEKWLRDQGN